ncbi:MULTISPECIES: Dabb family protein [Bacteroidota]|uniref:Dabb family protein n=1 Tax=Flectobacillus rivi TaxID=2984209 RepID=A0ABT6Z8U8_9BACT|nr:MULTISPECIES: Dabb family protein [Bacteroidota]MDI9877360.1 Dabb family protein [Flectobacillus rivi]NBB26972.1 twin-arginine translocation signal domain-containing protein [Cellulophaga sp. BC115SP]
MKKLERRSFLTKAAAASALTAVALPSEAKPKKKIFIHHVYFWLKNPSSEADKNKLIEGLTGLSKVPTIRFHHIGTPASTNRSVIERGYSVSWMLFFDNLEEEEIYQKHPIHLKFVEDYSHLWEKVIVYDAEQI